MAALFQLKRFANRWIGCGPHRVRPFAEVIAGRIDPSLGVHCPEQFDGVLKRLALPGAGYWGGRSLLGQAEQGELLGGRRRYLPRGFAPQIEMGLYSLSDGAVVSNEGIVYCPRQRVAVAESMRRWLGPLSGHPVLAAPRLPAAKELDGTSLSIGALSAEGYYHFLLETIPRLWLAREFLPRTAQLLANGRAGGFQAAWLRRAGIAPEKLIWLEGLSHYRCEQLLFADLPMADHQVNSLTVGMVRAALDAVPGVHPGAARIWISRADAASRRIAWEEQLVRELGGFSIVTLNQMSPADQIETMRGAAVVAGPHGAGFANLPFCAAGTKVIELFPGGFRPPTYGRLAEVCELPYAWASVDFGAGAAPAGLAQAINQFAAAR